MHCTLLKLKIIYKHNFDYYKLALPIAKKLIN